MTIKNAVLALLTMLTVTLTSSLRAADFPAKPITIVVPSKAGGSTDRIARIFSEVAKKFHGDYRFVIKNVPGTGGLQGFEDIANAKTDGSIIGLVFTPQLVAHVASGRANYTLDSFHFIGNVVQDPGIIVVPANSNITNLAELTEAAKTRRLTIAVNGLGSDDYLAAKAYEELQGVTFYLLPTNGSTEQKAGILGGHIDAAFMNLSQIVKQHRADEARIIAVLTDDRHQSVDVPTAKEQGIDVFMTATRGFIAPAGVSSTTINELTHLFEEVVQNAEFIERANNGLLDLWPLDSADYKLYLTNLLASTQTVFDKHPW